MQPEITEFLNRFSYFNDAVIRSVFVEFRNKIVIIVSAKDNEELSNDSWANVILEMVEVVEFSFCENPRESYQVLSNDLHITFSDELCFLDFGYFTDKPENPSEYKKSKFYVICKQFGWKIADYQE